MNQTDDIWNLVEPYLAAENLELDDLEVSGRGRGKTLRITVDGSDLHVDRLARVSRGLSRLLDDAPTLQTTYQLEVSSPGLERKLRRHRHYEKSVGREVVVKAAGSEVNTTHRGTLVSVGDSAIVVEEESGSEAEIAYQDVLSAKTVFKWEKAPKPGH